jgi:hypothetical protein
MKMPNRDLLVLVKDEFLGPESMETELERINKLLMSFETVDNLCVAHEIFDMNRYKMLRKLNAVRKVVEQKQLKPFVFVINKN